MQLAEAVDAYLQSISIHMAAGSVKAYRYRLRFFIKRVQGDVESIKLADLQRVTASYKRGRSNSSTRLLVNSLRSFFDWCEAEEIIEHSPATRLKAPPRDQHVPRALSKDTARKVVMICEYALDGEYRDIRNATLVLSLLFAGLRRAEAVGLRWRDIDTEGKVLIVLGKGNKERRIPMHNRLQAAFRILDRHKRGHGVVFAREDGEMLSLTSVNQVIFDEWLRPRLGQHITPHQLRHTFATIIIEKGGSMDEVRALLGHTSIATTQTYVLTSAERLRKAVDLL